MATGVPLACDRCPIAVLRLATGLRISTKTEQEFSVEGETSATSVKVTTIFEHRSKNVLDQPDN